MTYPLPLSPTPLPTLGTRDPSGFTDDHPTESPFSDGKAAAREAKKVRCYAPRRVVSSGWAPPEQKVRVKFLHFLRRRIRRNNTPALRREHLQSNGAAAGVLGPGES